MPLYEERVWVIEDLLTAPEGTRLGEMVSERRDVPYQPKTPAPRQTPAPT